MLSMDFATDLLKKQKLVVVPGTAFGECGEGFVRISYAYSMEELRKAISRLSNYLKTIRKQL